MCRQFAAVVSRRGGFAIELAIFCLCHCYSTSYILLLHTRCYITSAQVPHGMSYINSRSSLFQFISHTVYSLTQPSLQLPYALQYTPVHSCIKCPPLQLTPPNKAKVKATTNQRTPPSSTSIAAPKPFPAGRYLKLRSQPEASLPKSQQPRRVRKRTRPCRPAATHISSSTPTWYSSTTRARRRWSSTCTPWRCGSLTTGLYRRGMS